MGGPGGVARTPGTTGAPGATGAAGRPGAVTVEFWGVRGSTPCDGPAVSRYGGNTSCVVVEAPGEAPLILDLGTGLRGFGSRLQARHRDDDFSGTALLTHLHWDHIQGLPFFGPVSVGGGTLDVYGPRYHGAPLSEVFADVMRPPYFPVRPDGLAGTVRFHDVGSDDLVVGGCRVRSGWVPHTGPTLGFRIEVAGVSVVYVPDHGSAFGRGGDGVVPAPVLDLCEGADLLIHDAQYTHQEQAERPQFGHCTVEYAVEVARRAGVRSLALFHHDPAHSDALVDTLASLASDRARQAGGFGVVAAYEGLVLEVAPRPGAVAVDPAAGAAAPSGVPLRSAAPAPAAGALGR